MDGTETRQRRPEELGLPHTLSTGRLPAASEDGPPSVPESQRVATKLLETELSRETALSIGFQHWPVFVEVKDLLTLVPPLVGLKGNLEMTLASRLSTAVSGHLDIWATYPSGRDVSAPAGLPEVACRWVGWTLHKEKC